MTPAKILFCELLGGIGDVVLALPAIHALACSHHPASVTVATFGPGAELLIEDPEVERVVVVERGPGQAARAVGDLVDEGGWDVIVTDATYDAIPEIVADSAPHVVADLWRSPPPEELIDLRFLRLLVDDGLVDPALAELAPTISLRPDEQDRAEAWWEALGPRPRTLLVPRSGMAVKEWSPDRWHALDAHLVRAGATVALGIDPPGSLRRAAAIAGAADLVVAPDTGLARVATALGTPTVCLFGPTMPARYGLRPPHANLMSRLPCAERQPVNMTHQPCWYSGRCVYEDRATCVDELRVDQVLAACLERLVVPRGVRRPVTRRLVKEGSEDPGVEELAAALVPLLGGDGIADVVLPDAVDLEVAQRRALVSQPELAHHPPAGVVARDDGDL